MLFRRPESPARCRESQKSTSVYIYDHDALRLLRPWLSGVSPQLWDDYYELSESPWNVLNRSESCFESEPFMSLHLFSFRVFSCILQRFLSSEHTAALH